MLPLPAATGTSKVVRGRSAIAVCVTVLVVASISYMPAAFESAKAAVGVHTVIAAEQAARDLAGWLPAGQRQNNGHLVRRDVDPAHRIVSGNPNRPIPERVDSSESPTLTPGRWWRGRRPTSGRCAARGRTDRSSRVRRRRPEGCDPFALCDHPVCGRVDLVGHVAVAASNPDRARPEGRIEHSDSPTLDPPHAIGARVDPVDEPGPGGRAPHPTRSPHRNQSGRPDS